MFHKKRWVPPGALIFAQLSHGASWVILLWLGIAGSIVSLDFGGIAWIHTVALGWATMASLAILLHVIPRFTDVSWRFEGLARRSIFVFGVGVLFFVIALFAQSRLVVFAAGILVAALLVYLAAAFGTLRQALAGERMERVIATVFTITLAFLLATALAGFGLAFVVSGYEVPLWIAKLPWTHAVLGIFGWLSLLVFGVSTATVRPITGNKSRSPVIHISVGAVTMIGAVMLAVGLAGVSVLVSPGAVLVGLAAVLYAVNLFDIVARATVSHRPPQAFLVASGVWLLCALAFGAASLLGHQFQLEYGFVILAGWIGQMLNAHVYHIGVRLLLTIYRGEDDETRPQSVLDARLSWISFCAFQVAVGMALFGLLFLSRPLVAGAGLCGLIGWLCMMLNLALVRRRVAESL